MRNVATAVGEVTLMIIGAGLLMAAWAALGPFSLPVLLVLGVLGEKIYKFFK